MIKSYKVKDPEPGGLSSNSMVRRFGKVMSFNGRLNSITTSDSTSALNLLSMAPTLSGSTMSMMTFLEDPQDEEQDSEVLASPASLLRTRQLQNSCVRLGEQLASAQAALREKERILRRIRIDQDQQLAILLRQMMSFECGLRKKEKELEVALRQRDKIIREQEAIIQFLMQKTGSKTRNIHRLADEALAKIPQIADDKEAEEEEEEKVKEEGKPLTVRVTSNVPERRPTFPVHLTTIRVNAPPALPPQTTSNPTNASELTSIVEAPHSENDSDSAIILDESMTSTLVSTASSSDSTVGLLGLRRISRSVSDVVSVTNNNSIDNKLSNNNLKSDLRLLKSSSISSGSSRENNSYTEDSKGSSSDCECSGSTPSPSGSIEEELASYETSKEDATSFLLRHGSYERYKIRTKLRKDIVDPSVNERNLLSASFLSSSSNSLSPVSERSGIRLQYRNEIHSDLKDNYATSSESNGGATSGSKHRNVVKPRDVKNRSTKRSRSNAHLVSNASFRSQSPV